jgi:acetate kinase
MKDAILTVNAGSSSIKFALFSCGEAPSPLLRGKIDRIGHPGTALSYSDLTTGRQSGRALESPDKKSAGASLLDWLDNRCAFAGIRAIGHRVVFGMDFSEPQLVQPDLLRRLHEFILYDPDHLPGEIELIEIMARAHPEIPQVACFDTAFHRTLPPRARLLPIPRRYASQGVVRYGFHGLSCAFLLEELARIAGPSAASGRIILAHLGSGASLTAVKNGASVDTTMGFTPAAGIPMATRPGDLDPGVIAFLLRKERLSPGACNNLINRECGLLGLSETSGDIRDLLDREGTDVRAAEAVESFCYATRKSIGGLAAGLGGLDTLVFAGGIGENAPVIRSRICRECGFLGLELDEEANRSSDGRISLVTSRVAVYVIKTDEERMIAKSVNLLVPPRAGDRSAARAAGR